MFDIEFSTLHASFKRMLLLAIRKDTTQTERQKLLALIDALGSNFETESCFSRLCDSGVCTRSVASHTQPVGWPNCYNCSCPMDQVDQYHQITLKHVISFVFHFPPTIGYSLSRGKKLILKAQRRRHAGNHSPPKLCCNNVEHCYRGQLKIIWHSTDEVFTSHLSAIFHFWPLWRPKTMRNCCEIDLWKSTCPMNTD